MKANEFNKHLKYADVNRHSFKKLYEEYYSKAVLHISVKFNASVAQDIAHEFFCNLIEGKYKNVDYVKNPVSWIYKVLDNIAINSFNKEAKYVSLSDFDFADYGENIDTILDVKRLLEILDDYERKIIYFRFFEGYSLKELSEIFGIKYDNLRKKYSAIIKKIKKNAKDVFSDETKTS